MVEFSREHLDGLLERRLRLLQRRKLGSGLDEVHALSDQIESIAKADPVAALVVLSHEATPGHWKVDNDDLLRVMGQPDGDTNHLGHSVVAWPHIAEVTDLNEGEANAAFIVACVNYVREHVIHPRKKTK